MAYHDLREFMKACEDAGEMVTIDKEVDWNLEVGAISRRICEIGAPMAHMTNIRGVKNGASILGSPLSKGWNGDFSRFALGLELDPRAPYELLMDELVSRMETPIRQVAPAGCADASLMKRLRAAGLEEIIAYPTFHGSATLGAYYEPISLSHLNDEEQATWHTAKSAAIADGTFSVMHPAHCAIGTKPQ